VKWKNLKKILNYEIKELFQIYRFIFVGIITVSLDAFFYFLLINLNFFTIYNCKRISFILGSIFAFYANREFVFKVKNKTKKQLLYFAILYFSSFIINSISHDFVVLIFNIKILAFIIATGFSTLINYIGQKYLVFRP